MISFRQDIRRISMPVSSRTSRQTAWSMVSPYSTLPPGNSARPAQVWSSRRTPTRNWSSQRTMPMATCNSGLVGPSAIEKGLRTTEQGELIYCPYFTAYDPGKLCMIPIDLSAKVALVTGVSDNESFAWSIAKTLQAAGAKLIFASHPRVVGIVDMFLTNDSDAESRKLPGGGSLKVDKLLACDVG